MKKDVQLFPQFVDDLNKLEQTYAQFPALEGEDLRAKDFIDVIRNEFDLKNIVNFYLPKNLGRIIDMFEGRTVGEIMKTLIPNAKLPFPQIALEFEFNADNQAELEQGHRNFLKDFVVLAKDTVIDGENFIDVIVNYGVEVREPNGKIRGKVFKSTDAIARISTDPTKSDDEWIKVLFEERDEAVAKLFENRMTDIGQHGIIALIFMLAVLSCQNVEIQQGFPPSILENNKRIKKGKTPYRQLNYIMVRSMVSKTDKKGKTGSHTPKCTHVRRGHFRTYADKGVTIWVDATVVNSNGAAVKPKDYYLK